MLRKNNKGHTLANLLEVSNASVAIKHYYITLPECEIPFVLQIIVINFLQSYQKYVPSCIAYLAVTCRYNTKPGKLLEHCLRAEVPLSATVTWRMKLKCPRWNMILNMHMNYSLLGEYHDNIKDPKKKTVNRLEGMRNSIR